MPIGDGIRRNIAHISTAERMRFRDAVVELNSRYYSDNVSKWVKQDRIHQATHVHGGPAFIPWHRELCNRFEQLLREADGELSLHYWDWTEDPRRAGDGAGDTIDLFTTEFMGVPDKRVGAPFTGFPSITRNVASGKDAPVPPGTDTDLAIINSTNGVLQTDQWKIFREKLEREPNHNSIHAYIGGSIGNPHTAFEDPFVFLLHSNVDRLWAMWQSVSGDGWRLDPDQVYGSEDSHPNIVENLEPWAGGRGLRPWAPPEKPAGPEELQASDGCETTEVRYVVILIGTTARLENAP